MCSKQKHHDYDLCAQRFTVTELHGLVYYAAAISCNTGLFGPSSTVEFHLAILIGHLTWTSLPTTTFASFAKKNTKKRNWRKDRRLKNDVANDINRATVKVENDNNWATVIDT